MTRPSPRPAARTTRPEAAFWVGLATVAVSLPLLDLLATAPEFFVAQALAGTGVIVVTLAMVVVPTLLALMVAVIGTLWSRWAAGVDGVLASMLGTMIVLGFLRSHENLPTVLVIAISVMLGALFARAALRSPTVQWAGSLAAIAAFVAPAWFLVQPGIQSLWRSTNPTPDSTVTIARPAPVVMVVFDELALSVLLDESLHINAQRFPHLAALAGRSTWYRRTAAAAETTGKALPALLSGTWPRHQTPPTAAAYPHNLFSGLAGSVTPWAFEPMSRLCPDDLNRATRPAGSKARQARRIVRDLGIVYLHRILPASLTERLPTISQGWRDFTNRRTPGPVTSTSDDETPFDIFQEAVAALRDDRRATLDRFLDSMDRATQPAVHVLHVLLPHAPSTLTAEGHHYDADAREPGRREGIWQPMPFWIAQAYQRYILQTQYVDAFIGRLTARLEARGLFDDAVIVITADHGVAFRAGHHRRLLALETASDIVPVPLLIKAPGQREGTIVDRAVSAVDIVPTIFDLLDVTLPSGWALDGRSARDPGHDRAVLPILTEDGTVTDLTPVVFDGMIEMVRYQRERFGTGDDPLDLYRYGPHGELVGQRLVDLAVGTPEHWQWAHQHAESYEHVDLGGATLPAMLDATVYVPRDGRPDGDLAITLNGTIAATMPLPLIDRINRRISVMLPTRLFIPGANTVGIYRIRDTQRGFVLHPLPHAITREPSAE